jgi:hypothetical protein
MPKPTVPSNVFPPLYTAVGNLVVNWAIAESALNHIIAIIYQKAGGKHVTHKIPVAFKRRVKFLRLCFNRVDALKPYADEGRDILRKAAKLTFIRNAVIHGAVSNYEPATQQYTFTKLDVVDNDTIHQVNSVTTTLSDLNGAAIDSQNVTRVTNALSDRLMDAFVR